MKTADLIHLLARQKGFLSQPLRKQMRKQLLLSLPVCVVLLSILWGINPHLRSLVIHPAFLTKALWLIVLSTLSWQGVMQLARPGFGPVYTFWGLMFGWVFMFILGGLQSYGVPPDVQQASWLGASWNTCSISIIALAVPVLVSSLWALKSQASTQPVWAGAAAGVFSASLSAMLYSLHCTEIGLGFFALWYGAGIFAVSVLGAFLGKYFLRW